MTKTFSNTFAAALVAASVFGASSAFAGGDYYVGGSPDAVKTEAQSIDTVRTHSINDGRVLVRSSAIDDLRVDRGDYRSVAPVNAN